MKNSSGSGTIPEGLRQAAKQRSDSVLKKLTDAMMTMERERADNDGIYPHNRGRINQAEVCRRAQVSKVTLQGPSHKTTTKVMVDSWVSTCAVKRTPEIRLALTQRANEWKADHDKVASHYAVAMLDLVEAENRIRSLEKENAALRAQLNSTGHRNVKALPTFRD